MKNKVRGRPRAENLRITKLRCTPVSVPMKNAYSFSVGKVYGTSKVIVEVETSEGTVGVGETFPSWTQDVLEKHIAHRLAGENPFNLERVMARCLPTNANPSLPYVDVFYLAALGGVEMALWDIMGKVVGVPSAMLMGGIYRAEIPFSDYVFVSGPSDEPKEYIENVVVYAKRLVAKYGSPLVDIKLGVLEPRHDIEMIAAVRQTLGDKVALRVDANCAWTEQTALRTITELEKYDIANMEEPCGTLAADSRIRKVVRTPMSAHSTRVSDVVEAGLDAAVVNPILLGGFSRAKKRLAIAEDAGIDFWLHSRGELGFATAAYMHFIAANRHIVLPSQTLFRPNEHMLTKEGAPEFTHGVMRLPKGEGLGVTLDTAAMEKYNGVFKDVGEYDWQSDTGRSPPFY